MANLNNFRIPEELIDRYYSIEDVSILVGENGSGKSTLLNELARYHLQYYDNLVIGIANTIHDKFKTKSSRFKTLKASQGKPLVRRTIVEAFKNATFEDQKKLRNIARTLEYTGFSPTIGVRLSGLSSNYGEIVTESKMSEDDKDLVLYFLKQFEQFEKQEFEILWINLADEKFTDTKNSYLINLIAFEGQLRSLKAIRSIDFFFRKNDLVIHFSEASSGELTMISSLIYLTATITENSILLIDEPENSLHPKWQVEYTKVLLDLFYLYQPKIIIATHSPLIINGSELNAKKPKIFKGKFGDFSLQRNEPTNVEEIYSKYFDVTTPENRFVSEIIVQQMNLLAAKKISFSRFENFLNHLENNSYDDLQKQAFEGIIELGRKISDS